MFLHLILISAGIFISSAICTVFLFFRLTKEDINPETIFSQMRWIWVFALFNALAVFGIIMLVVLRYFQYIS